MRLRSSRSFCPQRPRSASAPGQWRSIPPPRRPTSPTGPPPPPPPILRLEDWNGAATGFAAYVKAHPHAKDAKQAMFLLGYAELKAGRLQRRRAPLRRAGQVVPTARRLRAGLRRTRTSCRRKGNAGARSCKTSSTGECARRRGALSSRRGRAPPATRRGGSGVSLLPRRLPDGLARAPRPAFSLAEALDATGDARRRASCGASSTSTRRPTAGAGRRRRISERRRPSAPRARRARDGALRRHGERRQRARVEARARRARARRQARRVRQCSTARRACSRRASVGARRRCSTRRRGVHQGEGRRPARQVAIPGRALLGAKGARRRAVDASRAAAMFEKVWRDHAQHSYADDARIREAELYDGPQGRGEVERAPGRAAGGVRRGRSEGRGAVAAGFHAWRKGDLAGAARFLEQELTMLPREEGWWEAGRTLYWLGARRRSQRRRRQRGRSLCARRARVSAVVLRAAVAQSAAREVARARRCARRRAQAPGRRRRRRVEVPPARRSFGEAGFRRGVELARLGLGAEAKRELALAGIEVPKKKGAVTPDPIARSCCGWPRCSTIARASTRSRTSSRAIC